MSGRPAHEGRPGAPGRRALGAAALAVALLSAPDTALNAGREADVATIGNEALAGVWRRVTEAPCAARYPAELELRAGGIYFAPGAPEAGAWWHGGDWAVADDGRLVIQVANDEMVPYRLAAVSEEAFTIEDGEGCRVTYRRAGA